MKKFKRITQKEWMEEGIKRYGKDMGEWIFKCPSCGINTKLKEWLDDKEGKNMAAFSCIGRIRPKKSEAFNDKTKKNQPCNYAGGGLFRINPIIVVSSDETENEIFDFADDPLCEI